MAVALSRPRPHWQISDSEPGPWAPGHWQARRRPSVTGPAVGPPAGTGLAGLSPRLSRSLSLTDSALGSLASAKAGPSHCSRQAD